MSSFHKALLVVAVVSGAVATVLFVSDSTRAAVFVALIAVACLVRIGADLAEDARGPDRRFSRLEVEAAVAGVVGVLLAINSVALFADLYSLESGQDRAVALFSALGAFATFRMAVGVLGPRVTRKRTGPASERRSSDG